MRDTEPNLATRRTLIPYPSFLIRFLYLIKRRQISVSGQSSTYFAHHFTFSSTLRISARVERGCSVAIAVG